MDSSIPIAAEKQFSRFFSCRFGAGRSNISQNEANATSSGFHGIFLRKSIYLVQSFSEDAVEALTDAASSYILRTLERASSFGSLDVSVCPELRPWLFSLLPGLRSCSEAVCFREWRNRRTRFARISIVLRVLCISDKASFFSIDRCLGGYAPG